MAYYGAGTYRCQITGQAFGKQGAKNTPYFALQIKVLGYYHPETGDFHPENANYDREVKLWITEKTVEHVVPKLRAIGYEGSSFKTIDPATPDYQSFAGVETDFVCQIENNNGKDYEKWDFPMMSQAIENTVGVSRELDTLFGKKLKAVAGVPSVPAPAKTRPVPQAVPQNIPAGTEDDEVPF